MDLPEGAGKDSTHRRIVRLKKIVLRDFFEESTFEWNITEMKYVKHIGACEERAMAPSHH